MARARVMLPLRFGALAIAGCDDLGDTIRERVSDRLVHVRAAPAGGAA